MKKRIVSFILTLNIMISVASTTYDENKKIYHISGLDDYEPNTLIEFLDLIYKVPADYSYNAYYPQTKEIDVSFESDDFIEHTNDLDYRDLVNVIRENSLKKYDQECGLFYDSNKAYSEEEKVTIEEIDRMITFTLQEAINLVFLSSTNDAREDICKLRNLTIKKESLPNDKLAFYISDNTIVLDYHKIISGIEKNSMFYTDKKEKNQALADILIAVFHHEINHARQNICEHRINSRGDVTNISLEKISFYIEASAESARYQLDKNATYDRIVTGPFFYDRERKFENLLFLLVVFKENKIIDSYYNAIFDSDYRSFLNFFEIDDIEKLKTFKNIICSIDTLCERTELYEKRFSISKEDIVKEVGCTYLIDIFKIALKDLMTAIEKENISYDDSIMLYLFIKNYITDREFTVYSDAFKNEKTYDRKYVDSILILEKIFEEYLIKKFDTSTIDFTSSENIIRLSEFENYALGVNTSGSEFAYLLNKYPIIKNIITTRRCISSNSSLFDSYTKTLDLHKF